MARNLFADDTEPLVSGRLGASSDYLGAPQESGPRNLLADDFETKAQALADKLEGYRGESGAGDLFQNAFGLGLSDKVAGAAGAVGAVFDPDMTMREGYNLSRRAQEIIEERARDRSGALGTAAEIAGTVSTGMLAKAPVAATALGRIAQAGREAGVLGTIQGAGDSDADTVGGILTDAATGGAFSAVAGGALSSGIELARGAFKAGRAIVRGVGDVADDEAGRASRKVVKALADDGISPGQAAARMAKRGTALINTGDENTLGLARAASAKPGEGRKVLNKALDAQQKTSRSKVMGAVSEALGGDDVSFNNRVADMVKTRSSLGEKQYEAAFARNFGKSQPMVFDDLAARVPADAVRNAQKIARAEGRPFGEQLVAAIDDAGNVSFARTPSLREWHYIQRGLRSAADSAYRSGVGEVGTAYKALHKDILKAMDDVSPIYAKARKSYASQSAMIDALKTGREILNPQNTRNVDMIVSDLAEMSKAEKDMVKIGLARQIEDMMKTTPDTAGDVVRKIFGTPAKREAVRAVFDSDSAFRQFRVKMTEVAKELKSFQYVRTGSRTSFVDAEKQSAGILADAATGAVDLTTGGATTTMLRGAAKILRDIGGMDEGVAREVAKIMVEKDPQAVLKALQKTSSRVKGQAAREAMLRKAIPFARAIASGGGAGVGTELATVR